MSSGYSNKEQVKRELVFCLKGARADLSKELHLQGKLEKDTKVKERLPSTQESNKISWKGKKIPYPDSAVQILP